MVTICLTDSVHVCVFEEDFALFAKGRKDENRLKEEKMRKLIMGNWRDVVYDGH